MAAGLSRKQIQDRVRVRLRSIAQRNGGEYVPATGGNPPLARGTTEDGLSWTARFAVSRASNGETFGTPLYTVACGGAERVFSGLHGGLPGALDAARAERDGTLVYVVAHGGAPGARLDVGEAAFTRELGRARWAQQQTGNVANLWVARLGSDGKATVLREFGYTDPEGHRAMHDHIRANGLSIHEAQRTLATDPALAVLDARARAAPAAAPAMGM